MSRLKFMAQWCWSCIIPLFNISVKIFLYIYIYINKNIIVFRMNQMNELGQMIFETLDEKGMILNNIYKIKNI